MIAYRIKPNGVWTGAQMQADPYDGLPAGWVRAPAPPAVGVGQYAVFAGGAWLITDAEPTYISPSRPGYAISLPDGEQIVTARINQSGGIRRVVGSSYDELVISPSGGDDTARLNIALSSGAKNVRCTEGDFLTSGALYVPSGVDFYGAGRGRTRIVCTTSYVAQTAKRIPAFAVVALDGSCPADDYGTYSIATGDYYTTSANPFAAATTIKPGSKTFTAGSASELANYSVGKGAWLHLGEGLCAWHWAKSEFVQVESVADAVVTLRTATRNGYSNAPGTLGAFIRSYALTESPGGGAAGYPNMSTWIDAGWRPVNPVMRSTVRDMTLVCRQSGGVIKIGWLAHLTIGCTVDVEIDDGTFWCLDSQDFVNKTTGGMYSSSAWSSYLGNGCNDITCDINICNPVALEEGAQRVRGTIRSLGYSTIKQYVANVNLEWHCTASTTPALQIATVKNVTIRPYLKSRSAALSLSTPRLSIIAPNLPQAYLYGEAASYYGCSVTTVDGECASSDSPTDSIYIEGGGQVRCVNTAVTAMQTARYKGTQIVDGVIRPYEVAALPLFRDLDVGERFVSQAIGEVIISGVKETTILQQFNFSSGTRDTLIVNDVSAGGGIAPGDIAVFRLSDSASGPQNWTWAAVKVTAVNPASKAVMYAPANPSGRTAITTDGENAIRFFRVRSQIGVQSVKTQRSGAEAETGGFIGSIGTAYGAPLQLGDYHLWVDSTGRLRIKNGAPSSDIDGTVVGTQT